MLALLIYMDTQGLVPLALLAATLHELGHYSVVRLFGGRITRFCLGGSGGAMELDARYPLKPGQEMLSILAGPAVNILLAYWSGKEGDYLFSGLNLGLALFNLLPIYPLDGGRFLRLALDGLLEEGRAERVGWYIGCATLFCGLLLTTIGMVRYGWNITLIGMLIWLGWNLLKGGNNQDKYKI